MTITLRIQIFFIAGILSLLSLSLSFTPTLSSTFRNRQTTLSNSFAPTLPYSSVPDEESSIRSNFDKRMRDLVFGKKERLAPSPRRRSGGKRPENIRTVESLQEYKAVVANEKERIVVVRFFATWCKACKAIAPGFYRLARNYPNVLFVEVPVTDHNAALHQGLGIPSIPYGHIYHPEAGLAEEVKINRKFFPRFESMVRWHVDGSCEAPDGEAVNPFSGMDSPNP